MVQISYLGLGKMGFNMAVHIANRLDKEGEAPLLVYNRTIDKTEEFVTTGSKHSKAATLEQIATLSDIIFSCLFDDESVLDILGDQLIGSGLLKKGAILVEQATITAETAKIMAKRAAETGVHYLSCPVMGPPPRAKAALLIPLLSGGTNIQRQAVLPWIENVIGKTVIQLGDDAGAASRLKLCGNFFVFAMIESLAEGMTLGEASPGVGQEHVKTLIDALFPGTILVDYSQRMLDKSYNDTVRFSLDGAAKDTQHILGLAQQTNVDLPIIKVFQEHVSTLKERRPHTDVSGIVGVLRENAGLDFDLRKP